MSERLYTTFADVYDALYRELKDYERETDFLRERLEERGETAVDRALILGCGPGEHATYLTERGFEVVGIDASPAMLELAREKSDATFRVGRLPDIEADGAFGLIALPFSVINHLEPEALEPTLRTAAELLADGGVLVFDNGAFPSPAEEPGPARLEVHATDAGDVARLVQLWPLEAGRVRWNSLVFVQDRETFFVDGHDLSVFDDEEIDSTLSDLGFDVETHDGYGTDGYGTVFVGY